VDKRDGRKKIPGFGAARLPNDLKVASGLLTYSQTFTVVRP